MSFLLNLQATPDASLQNHDDPNIGALSNWSLFQCHSSISFSCGSTFSFAC
jgi:hypothetical protein